MKLATKKALLHTTRERVHAPAQSYSSFEQIDGRHEWQSAVPEGFVLYNTRILRKSKIVFFNFPLAKEMGLIPTDHPNELNKKLERKLIETFALRIINEYDIANKNKYPAKDIKAHPYMATRYVQLQHNCKRGTTSGDGRSIWNGGFTSRGVRWDISSCGTGATCLSPGAVETGKLIRTGDPKVCYGNGLADIDEGLSAALQSEIFHAKGIETERTLLILEAPGKSAINVRAASSLLRPSHVFSALKQNKHKPLKAGFDLFIDRKIKNGQFPPLPTGSLRYDAALRLLARRYGQFAAKLEHEYIFCWLAWDGDNMLMNGGIIDYGSIRQFGIYHHRYRYDDVERFSTSLPEQKLEARYLVQTLAQMCDFVKTGKRRAHDEFSTHPVLKLFEQEYTAELERLLLRKMGFSASQSELVIDKNSAAWTQFKASFRYFENALVPDGPRTVADGVNQPALYDTSVLLRELPRALMRDGAEVNAEQIFAWIATPLALKKIRNPSSSFAAQAQKLVLNYKSVAQSVAPNKNLKSVLLELSMRASIAREAVRLTGDGAIFVIDLLLNARKRLSTSEFQNLILQLVNDFSGATLPVKKLRKGAAKIRMRALKLAESRRHSI